MINPKVKEREPKERKRDGKKRKGKKMKRNRMKGKGKRRSALSLKTLPKVQKHVFHLVNLSTQR